MKYKNYLTYEEFMELNILLNHLLENTEIPFKISVSKNALVVEKYLKNLTEAEIEIFEKHVMRTEDGGYAINVEKNSDPTQDEYYLFKDFDAYKKEMTDCRTSFQFPHLELYVENGEKHVEVNGVRMTLETYLDQHSSLSPLLISQLYKYKLIK